MKYTELFLNLNTLDNSGKLLQRISMNYKQ